jgi:hypothetical protein
MHPLLDLAELVCGDRARRDVFEPLVADWQRELSEARASGRWRVVLVCGSGAVAYALSFARCVLMRDWLPTPRAAASAMLAFGLAKAVGLLTLLGLSYAWGSAVDLGSIQTQAFLLFSAVIVVPPAFLPALFLMRRDPRSNIRHAIVAIAVAVAGTSTLVVVTSEDAINSYFSTFEAFEREYARSLANDRAGRYQYPGTAARKLGGETTLEQRRESFTRFDTWRAEQIAKRPPRTRTWTQSLRRFQPAALAVLFGVMGWTLAGLAAPTFTRALLWWGLMAAAMLTLSATPGLFMRIAVHRLPYYWMTVPIFAAVTAALIVASRRKPPTPQASLRPGRGL